MAMYSYLPLIENVNNFQIAQNYVNVIVGLGLGLDVGLDVGLGLGVISFLVGTSMRIITLVEIA